MGGGDVDRSRLAQAAAGAGLHEGFTLLSHVGECEAVTHGVVHAFAALVHH